MPVPARQCQELPDGTPLCDGTPVCDRDADAWGGQLWACESCSGETAVFGGVSTGKASTAAASPEAASAGIQPQSMCAQASKGRECSLPATCNVAGLMVQLRLAIDQNLQDLQAALTVHLEEWLQSNQPPRHDADFYRNPPSLLTSACSTLPVPEATSTAWGPTTHPVAPRLLAKQEEQQKSVTLEEQPKDAPARASNMSSRKTSENMSVRKSSEKMSVRKTSESWVSMMRSNTSGRSRERSEKAGSLQDRPPASLASRPIGRPSTFGALIPPAKKKKVSIDSDGTRGSAGSAGTASASLGVNFWEDDQLKLQLLRAKSRPLEDMFEDDSEQGVPKASLHQCIQRFVSSDFFDFLSASMILANLLSTAVEVDYKVHHELLDSPKEFIILNRFAFPMFFLLEIVVRVVGQGWAFFSLRLNYLDVAVAIISVLDFLMPLSAAQLVALRMGRATRALCMLRIMRVFTSLRMLVLSILSTLKSLLWTVCLLSLIVLVFGTVFTDAVHQHLLSQNDGLEISPQSEEIFQLHYANLPRTMYTLFKAICGGVTWGEAADPLSEIHLGWNLCFLMYVAFTYFAVMNVVTGVFCHIAIQSASLDQEMSLQSNLEKKHMYIKALRELFGKIDTDQNNAVTILEFEEAMQDDTVQSYFAALDLTAEHGWAMFKLLDTDGSACLDVEEFVTGCLRLGGQARSFDLAMVSYEVSWVMNQLSNFIAHVDDQFRSLQGRPVDVGRGRPPLAPVNFG